jgi:hypothetical protein
VPREEEEDEGTKNKEGDEENREEMGRSEETVEERVGRRVSWWMARK